jgi:hypothetical protein
MADELGADGSPSRMCGRLRRRDVRVRWRAAAWLRDPDIEDADPDDR